MVRVPMNLQFTALTHYRVCANRSSELNVVYLYRRCRSLCAVNYITLHINFMRKFYENFYAERKPTTGNLIHCIKQKK